MASCKYWDSGFCYAPLGIESNSYDGECNEPLFCPYLISQMNETEKIKEQIKLLQSKLSLLEEAEKTKTPCEEAYKRVYGNYPVTDIADTCWSGSTWTGFSNGYNAAQKDYKVGEYQETVEEPKEEPKTLYQILRELDKPMLIDDVCSAVEKWIYQ